MSGSGTPSIGIVGAGAFGTALACVLAANGTPVRLYGRNSGAMAKIGETAINPRLPDIRMPADISVTADLAGMGAHHIVLFAIPSAAQVEFACNHAGLIAPDATIVMCAKGLDKKTGAPITDGLGAALPGRNIHVLSGPGFAADIASGLPTAMTLASSRISEAEAMASILSRRTFRLYASADMSGVQLCGALKNVLAIAAGIVMGAGLGESARAALIARGLAEMTRYVAAFGGLADTAAGLSGLGDLVLTATSTQSRNYRHGLALGSGKEAGRNMNEGSGEANTPLVEGAAAALAASAKARSASVPMPITDAVADIVSGSSDVASAIQRLLSRPLRIETV